MKRSNSFNNKGFSMVELIIVIAIMAILAAALAPVLIKYINKSRISSDIDTGKAVASAIMAVIADGGDFNDQASIHAAPFPVNSMDGADFKEEVFSVLGEHSGTLQGKAKKDMFGDPLDMEFYYTLDTTKNMVEVYYGGTDASNQIYPKLGSKLSGEQ